MGLTVDSTPVSSRTSPTPSSIVVAVVSRSATGMIGTTWVIPSGSPCVTVNRSVGAPGAAPSTQRTLPSTSDWSRTTTCWNSLVNGRSARCATSKDGVVDACVAFPSNGSTLGPNAVRTKASTASKGGAGPGPGGCPVMEPGLGSVG